MNKRSADSRPASNRLLGRDDPPPFIVTNSSGSSPFLLLGDHAGREIPKRLGDLGVPPSAMDRHIAWDIGIAGLGELLAARLDACFIRQTYSRLVIDCNRRPGEPDSTPEVSDGVPIPGNVGLVDHDLNERRREIFEPYHGRIAQELDRRARGGETTYLVCLHSFTPVFQGFVRPWRYGVLHRDDSPLSRRVLAQLRQAMGEAVGDNQPYSMDGSDNTVPLHADARGLDYLEIEVRQDLIADAVGQAAAAHLIAGILDLSA